MGSLARDYLNVVVGRFGMFILTAANVLNINIRVAIFVKIFQSALEDKFSALIIDVYVQQTIFGMEVLAFTHLVLEGKYGQGQTVSARQVKTLMEICVLNV